MKFPTPIDSVSGAVSVALVFLSAVGLCVILGKLPFVVFGVYMLASIATFFVYLKDKSAAKRGAWRTSEANLHGLSVIGGWPGALIAQQTLRHKSKKQLFRIAFWMTVILNCMILAWCFTAEGSGALQLFMANIR